MLYLVSRLVQAGARITEHPLKRLIGSGSGRCLVWLRAEWSQWGLGLSAEPQALSVLVWGRFIIWLEHPLVSDSTQIVLLPLETLVWSVWCFLAQKCWSNVGQASSFPPARGYRGFVRGCWNLSLGAWWLELLWRAVEGSGSTTNPAFSFHSLFRYFHWHRSDNRCKSIQRSIWEVAGWVEGFLAENVSVTLLIKMLLSSQAPSTCITSLKETLVSKHMGVSLGSAEVTCLDTERYGRCVKPVRMAGSPAASRVCFWGSNRAVIFVVLSKRKTLLGMETHSLQNYENHWFPSIRDFFLKLHVIVLSLYF